MWTQYEALLISCYILRIMHIMAWLTDSKQLFMLLRLNKWFFIRLQHLIAPSPFPLPCMFLGRPQFTYRFYDVKNAK